MKNQMEMTAEELYKLNRKKSKVYKVLAPVIFWVFLGLTIVFFLLAIHNSIGNIIEINNLLSVDSEMEREANYEMLVEKWGKWYIFTNEDSALTVSFINIPNALFSGLMQMYSALTIFCLAISILLGKVLFPMIVKSYMDTNDQLVDLTTLRSADKLNQLSGKTEKEKNTKKGWF